MGSLTRLGLGFCGLLVTPGVAFADVAPKCGCTIDGAGVGLGWLLLAGVTVFVVRQRRRDRR
jgi:MYXO-CTERM domain-containing protein